ncbi:MAG TPA: 16S rRNA (cytosine(1402)-N(4))-methyltransferase, partial [Phycisphaerales bacterium]|nr:16S rRNA (cytosine(1402)-N(4))-methyltransferase [Phycisphaerales bacterium]
MRDTDHIPVLLGPVLHVLRPAGAATADAASPLTFLDATAGLGGHAAAIARRLPAGSTVILNDLDAGNLDHAAARVAREAPHAAILTHRGNFAALPRWLADRGLSAHLFLADLGFASPQVDDPARGLSFLRDGPLDMRFDPTARTSAAELIASLPEQDLAQIIFEYGDERHSRAIARAVVEARRRAPITTTAQLADTVRASL